MALNLNPQSPAQATNEAIEQQSIAGSPSVAIAPGQPQIPMAGQSEPPSNGQVAAPPANANPVSSKNLATNSVAAINSSKGRPGDWARGVLAGVLHGVAGLGKTMVGMGADLQGPIGVLGTMAGSRPGQEYNDVQAAARARHLQSQNDVLFKQQVAKNDIDAKKASFDLERARITAQQHDDTFQQGIIDRNATMVKDGQSSGNLDVVASFLNADEAAKAASKQGLIAIPVSRVPQADGTYKPMYDVVQATGSHTLDKDQQDFLSKYVGKDNVTSESTSQWLQDYAIGTKNEIMGQTLQDVQNKLGIDTANLKATQFNPEAIGLFGNYYSQVAKQNPKADKVENVGEAYLHMTMDAGQKDKNGNFTPKALAVQKALPSLEAEFGGLKGIGQLLNADQAAFDRMIAAQSKNANDSTKILIDTAQKRLASDQTAFNQISARIGVLQNIVNQKGNETAMTGLLRAAGLADVGAAQTELSNLLSQRSQQLSQLVTDRQDLMKLSGNTLNVPNAAPPPPKIGDVVQGHRYIGGDPSKPASWQIVAPPPGKVVPGQSVKVF